MSTGRRLQGTGNNHRDPELITVLPYGLVQTLLVSVLNRPLFLHGPVPLGVTQVHPDTRRVGTSFHTDHHPTNLITYPSTVSSVPCCVSLVCCPYSSGLCLLVHYPFPVDRFLIPRPNPLLDYDFVTRTSHC